jgi:hypothetical protein
MDRDTPCGQYLHEEVVQRLNQGQWEEQIILTSRADSPLAHSKRKAKL